MERAPSGSRLDVASAIVAFLARQVYSVADSVVESKLSALPRDVDSVVGEVVAQCTRSRHGYGSAASLRNMPVPAVVYALLCTGLLRVGEGGFVVGGKDAKEVATAIFGGSVASELEKYLITVVATDMALMSAALGNAERIPTWFVDYIAENSPVRVAVEVVVLDRRTWSLFPPELKAKLFRRLDDYYASTVLRRAPWTVESRELLFEVLSKLVGEELPATATELVARYAPELVSEREPTLEEVDSVKLVSKPPALVRVDILYGLKPRSAKEFTVFDTRTKLGIVVTAEAVDEAVASAYSSLLDSYLEFREVVSELDEYSKVYGCPLSRLDEVVGEFRLPGIMIYDRLGDPVMTVPLQPDFRRAFESALDDVCESNNERERETVSK